MKTGLSGMASRSFVFGNMKQAIKAIYWGRVPPELSPTWGGDSVLLAAWPAPVDADACFDAAGFHEFEDSDTAWDSEWAAIVGRTLEFFGSRGSMQVIQAADDCYQTMPRFLIFSKMKKRELTLQEQIELVTMDDRFGYVMVRFGESKPVIFRVGEGHPILWFAIDNKTSFDSSELIKVLAESRPTIEKQLAWEHLLPR